MGLLYLGLTKGIRGVAETLQTQDSDFHMVKPGDMYSRVGCALQVFVKHPVDVVVAAEAITEQGSHSQIEWITERLRLCGIGQPMLLLSNRTNAAFVNNLLGQDARARSFFLPLFMNKVQNAFMPISGALSANVSTMLRASRQETPPPASHNARIPLQQPTDCLRADFASETVYLLGCKISPDQSRLVMRYMLEVGNPVGTSQLRSELGFDAETLEATVEHFRKTARQILKTLGYPADIPIIETLGQRGRQIHAAGLEHLGELKKVREKSFENFAFSMRPPEKIEFVDGSEFSPPGMRKKTMLLLLQAKGTPMPIDDLCKALGGVSPGNVRQYTHYLNHDIEAFLHAKGHNVNAPVIAPVFGGYRIIPENVQSTASLALAAQMPASRDDGPGTAQPVLAQTVPRL